MTDNVYMGNGNDFHLKQRGSVKKKETRVQQSAFTTGVNAHSRLDIN